MAGVLMGAADGTVLGVTFFAGELLTGKRHLSFGIGVGMVIAVVVMTATTAGFGAGLGALGAGVGLERVKREARESRGNGADHVIFR
jgi:hypothetical protein